MYKLVTKALPFLIAFLFACGNAHVYAAAPDDVILNTNGGSDQGNGLKIYFHRGTQMQIVKPNSNGDIKGQLYEQNSLPTSSNGRNNLDNGIYLRANNTIYGARHFAYSAPTDYSSSSLTTPTPATLSQGVVQTTTHKMATPQYSTLVAGPSVTVNWKYTYPLDYVTAEVTLVVPLGFPVSNSNPVRYYHAIDTYLGGSDNGCGVRYVDTNGKQIVGTYPLSSGNCPSSNSLPANLDVVESFRERTGKFDHYCVGFWNTFWSNSSSNACAIGKSASLSDTVTTTYQDTGAAIEYDFTAPGIYTFSYDFVVGSTFVPNYDHLEIRHGGSGTLCPVNVQVLACLSSTVPCPSDQMVNSGVLNGSVTVSPSSSTVTDTPDPFELGSAQAIANVSLQSSSAATYTLGVSGLTKAPLSGVKCWNTATNSQSCSFTFTNVPCVNTFECMENTLTYNNRIANSALRNPLYTKAMGASFDVDVVALLANGSQSTGYNSTTGLTVQLVDDSGGACGATVVAAKSITFAASDLGRKKVSFAPGDILRPHPNLRCKVTDAGLVKSGCSSDNFAIRPSSLAIDSVSPQQLTPSYTSSPVRRAGTDNFSMTVSSSYLTYAGTPKVDSTKLENHAGVTSVGLVNGLFGAANLGVSTGSTFTYSEVGHFRLQAQAIYDDTYAAVDSATGDCDNSFESSGVGTPKRFGCKFGNTAVSNYIGRFIPDHFKVTPGIVYTDGCGSFTYYDQDPGLVTPFTLEAKNAADVTTQYYTGNYAIFGLSNWSNYFFELLSGNGATITASSTNPSGTWGAGIASVQARHKITRPANAVPPETIKVYAQPRGLDGGVMVNSTKQEVFDPLVNNLSYPRFRYGRLAVASAHGSELLPLLVPIEAQYWNGAGFVRNKDDGCTAIPTSSIVMKNYKGNLNACETQLSIASPMSSGVLKMRLSAPGITGGTPNTGSVDLEVNLAAVSAGEMTCTGSAESSATSGAINWFGSPDPIGRATFGVYKAPIIYMRENF